MTTADDDTRFSEVARRIAAGSRVLRAWPLSGGVSAQVTVITIEQHNGTTQSLIVRQHGPADRQRNPQIATDEFRLLQILYAAGLPTPRPYDLDQSGAVLGAPYLAIEYIEGQPACAPADIIDCTLQLATQLARIHTLDCASVDLSFLAAQQDNLARVVSAAALRDESAAEARIRARLAAVWPLQQQNRPVLLHGDFWPGNTLWRDGQLVAVIDWEDAQTGDPLVDLANSRLEVLWAFGSAAMQRFTEQYLALTAINLANLPAWELYAALRHSPKLSGWGLDALAEQTMRDRLGWFVAQAFAQLAAQETAKHGEERGIE